MVSIKKLLLCCMVLALPLFGFSWGMLGHRIVGQIADSYLTAKARAEIKKNLR